MNPFDLRGPEFLLFYLLFSAVVIALMVILRRTFESGASPRVDLTDPYLIAYLREGEDEAIRVATVTLVDRGLLKVNGTRLKLAEGKTSSLVRRPLEQAILDKFKKESEAKEVFTDATVKRVADRYQDELQARKLLPDKMMRGMRRLLLFGAILALADVAAIKIYVALMRGHTNITFLIVLAVIAIILAVKVERPRLTARGKATIEDLQNLYGHLRTRPTPVSPGGGSIEAAMLAGVFGLAALPVVGFAFAHEIFPRPVVSPGTWTSSSSGSSCGSSCSSGSSCGSSCGGGGGGCGGCGS